MSLLRGGIEPISIAFTVRHFPNAPQWSQIKKNTLWRRTQENEAILRLMWEVSAVGSPSICGTERKTYNLRTTVNKF